MKRIFFEQTPPVGSLVTDRDIRHCLSMISHAESCMRRTRAIPIQDKELLDRQP